MHIVVVVQRQANLLQVVFCIGCAGLLRVPVGQPGAAGQSGLR